MEHSKVEIINARPNEMACVVYVKRWPDSYSVEIYDIPILAWEYHREGQTFPILLSPPCWETNEGDWGLFVGHRVYLIGFISADTKTKFESRDDFVRWVISCKVNSGIGFVVYENDEDCTERFADMLPKEDEQSKNIELERLADKPCDDLDAELSDSDMGRITAMLSRGNQ